MADFDAKTDTRATTIDTSDVLVFGDVSADGWETITVANFLASAVTGSYQPLDSDLTAIAALTTTSFGRSLLTQADASAARTTLGLIIGTDVQAYDAELAALAGLTSAANKLPYFTGSGTAATADFTAFGRSLVDDADAAAARTTLGLGTLATQSGTFSGTSSGTNTGDQSLFSTIAVSGQDNVVADATSDTLTLVAGSNVTITTDASTDTITISASGGGGGGGYETVQEEGSGLTQRATINFVGSGLTAADDSGNSRTNVSVQATLNSLASNSDSSGTLEKTGSTTVGTYAVTAAAKSLLDDADASAMRSTLGLAIGTDVQAYDADLAAVAGLASAGVIARTGSGTAAARTITGTTNRVTVTNGDGVSGNPTLDVGSHVVLTTGSYSDPSWIVSLSVSKITDFPGSTDQFIVSDGGGGLSVTNDGGGLINLNALALSGTVPIANGGTAASTAANARTNLGLGTLATQSGTFSGTSSGTNTGDQSLFSTIAVSGQDNVVADSTSDTLTLAAGANITITTNATTDTVTISATGGGTLGDGDYGDVVASSSGTVLTVESFTVANEATDTTCFPLFATAATGANLGPKTNANLTYNSSTGALGSTSFVGALTGNASTATTLQTARTIGGVSFDGSANIVPATITVADTTDSTCFVALFESATGDLAPKTDGALTYDASTGTLAATSLTGALTTASQTAITGVGTVTTGTWSATTIAVDKGGTGQTSYTDGQLLIGNTTGNTLAKATLTGTADQVVVTNGGGSITLSTPQSINTTSTPQFAGINVGHASDTTLTRASAGDLAIEGNAIYRAGGADVAVADGGTNLSSYTAGDVLYASGATTLAKLAVGAAGKVLTSVGGVPVYRDPAGDLATATDGATVTFDLATSRRQIVTLGGNRTLALSNDADGMAFTILLKQDGTGSRTVTWWSGIKWPGGTTPTLTTTAGKYDVFAFLRIASGEYIGFAGSLNH